jgi:hypothetical protein
METAYAASFVSRVLLVGALLALSLLSCGRGGTNGVEVLEEKVVVEVAASNKVPNPVPIQLR